MAATHIRWMIRGDMPEVLAIESAQFPIAWDEQHFIEVMRQANQIGMVAVDRDESVIGYMVYALNKYTLEILNFAVRPNATRRGIGRQMIDKLYGKLSTARRSRIIANIRETNLDACLFFKACGFRCVSVARNFYADLGEDEYQFVRRIIPSPAFVNRIEAYV